MMLDLSQPFLAPGETLVCFGDSLTAADPGYVSKLQELLPANRIVNAGRGGDKTPWALTRFQTDVLDRKPDALSILLGANDAAIGRGRWADEPMVSPEAYRCNLIWMIYLARQSGIRKISIATPLGSFEGDTLLEQGDILAQFCLAARQAANEAKVRLVPLDVMFRTEWAKHPGHTGLLLTRDGTHPTQDGYAMIAETILKAWRMPNEHTA